MGLIDFFSKINYEKRIKVFSLISLVANLFICIAKFIGSFIFHNYFLAVAGLFNVFIILSKGECLLGLTSDRMSFKLRNLFIFIFVLTAGIIYTFYSSRLLIYENYLTYDFTFGLALLIALVSFIELGVAIYGLIRVKRYGHFYRDIKIINFITALTALVLTEAAITQFANISVHNIKLNNGVFGMIVGITTIVLAVYIFFAPTISIIDREHNRYIIVDPEKAKVYFNETNILELPLSFSTIFKRYTFEAYLKENIVDGHIVLTKSFFEKSKISIKIIIIVFSPIICIPYFVLRLIYFFRTINIPKKLDKLMEDHGFSKIEIKHYK